MTEPKLKITHRDLPHWEIHGAVYFITFKTWQRLELTPAARQIVLDACLFFNKKRYQIFVLVVMPDHVHILMQPLAKYEDEQAGSLFHSKHKDEDEQARSLFHKNKNNNKNKDKDNNNNKNNKQESEPSYWPLSSIMHSIKSYSAKQILKVMPHIDRVWQSERYDRIVRDNRELENLWEYIRQNTMKAGLSDSPETYPFFWQETDFKLEPIKDFTDTA